MTKRKVSRLALLREAIGPEMTQKALAERAGLSTIYVKKLESCSKHSKSMSRAAAVAIASATGCSIEWLMGEGKALPVMGVVYEDDKESGWFSYDDVWRPSMALGISEPAQLRSRKLTIEQADNLANRVVLAFNDFVEIVSQTFQSKHRHQTWLALRAVEEELRVLRKRFKVKPRPVPYEKGDSRRDIIARIATRLGKDFVETIKKCTEP